MEPYESNGLGVPKPNNSPMRRQGSMRKVLHSSEGSDSLIGVSAKILERSEPKSLPALYYYNFFKEYHLMVEYNLLRKHLHPGVCVIPSSLSKSLWFGVIFVSAGLYRGGIFRFSIHLSKGFPDSKCPRVVFDSPVYHPNVDEETMELDLTRRFPDWCKETNHIWQVIDYVHSVLQCIDFTQPPCANEIAAQMYINERDEFSASINACIEASQKSIFDDPMHEDPHYPRFSKYNEKLHCNARQSLSLSQEEENKAIGTRKGYSWIQPGTVRAFSKPLL